MGLQSQPQEFKPLAICQIKVSQNLKENKEKIKQFIEKVESSLLIFPELSLTGYVKKKKDFNFCKIEKALEEIAFFCEKEKKEILLGLPVLKKEEVVNGVVHIKKTGEIEVVSEKIALYPELDEPLFVPGREKKIFEFGGYRIGVLICFELRIPEVARELVKQGAEVLIVMAQWPKKRLSHWRSLLKSRAIEDQVSVIGVNAISEIEGFKIGGHSLAFSYLGKCLGRLYYKEDFFTLIPEILEKSLPYPFKSPFIIHEKVLCLEDLLKILEKRRKKGEKVVFTNGCFDLLHAGHVDYLEKARALGDILVVGLNTDSSIKKIKGPERPVNSQELRARVLSGLSCVDYVVFFEEETPERLIKAIKPDILVKGADWEEDKIVGASFVKSYGGKVVRIPFEFNISTTKIIEKIRHA